MSDQNGITPALRGFLHVAFLRRLSLVPLLDRSTRRQMAEHFLRIHTDEQAREYIHAARIEIRTAKRKARAKAESGLSREPSSQGPAGGAQSERP